MRGTRADEQRLATLEDAIDRLREKAEVGTVVVEGSHDLAALDWLGIGGLHVTAQKGLAVAELVEELVCSPPPIVLLLDWDRAGGRLHVRLFEQLAARVQVDSDCRRRLAAICHCRSLEELPAELEALRRAVHGPRDR